VEDALAFFGLVAVPCAVYAVRVFFFSPRGKIRWALRRAGVVPIARVKERQLAKVVGRLRFAEAPPLIAPLSDRPCACWHITVKRPGGTADPEAQKKQVSDDLSGMVAIVDDSACHGTFWIEDDTGRALVEVVAPKLLITRDRRFESGILTKATPRLESLLETYGHTTQGRVFRKSLLCYEGVLEEGEQVAVFGLCRWEPDSDPRAERRNYRGAPSRLRISAPPGGDMLISDEPFALR
jgi:hypothetical protein